MTTLELVRHGLAYFSLGFALAAVLSNVERRTNTRFLSGVALVAAIAIALIVALIGRMETP